jgi:glycine cleavage system H protein
MAAKKNKKAKKSPKPQKSKLQKKREKVQTPKKKIQKPIKSKLQEKEEKPQAQPVQTQTPQETPPQTTQAEETAKKKTARETIYFTETHEWIKVSGNEGVVGITDYAVKKLTDLVHIELPEVGDEVVQGNPFGSIESVKAVSDLNAPVSGKVVEVNDEVISNLDLITNEPYDEGWLIKISISDPAEFDSLMTKKDYENYTKTLEEEGEE